MKLLNNKYQLSATDLANHLACKHLTELDRLVAKGSIKAPAWRDPALAILEKRGRDHEEAYVKSLKSHGLSVTDLTNQPAKATLEAMSKGIDVIVQARLGDELWIGRADILRRIDKPSNLGSWSYEIEDTKLSQNTRAGTVLQLCLYTDLITALQGFTPTEMHVVKPGEGFPKESFLYTDFQAYYRLVRHNFTHTMTETSPPATYPNPVSHCDICRWSMECDSKWHKDDHLCLIAGIRSLHIGELQRQGIQKLEQFAEEKTALREKPERGNEETFAKAHAQARIQLKGRKEDKLVYEFLLPEPGRGFSRLPEPSDADIYFDIESDPFVGDGGIEYLLGYVCKNSKGIYEYQCLWALDQQAEKHAFETFIDFVMDRWKQHPNMYIYHFSPYEPAAIKRLTGRHGTRETEVDRLLRGERFIDLFTVVRESMIASVEHYGLKDMEKFAKYARKLELPLANAARRRIECALELEVLSELSDSDRQTVADYNQDDCLSTAVLHAWLEERRTEFSAMGNSVSRPENKTGDASEGVQERQDEAYMVFKQLIEGLPDDRALWGAEEHAKWLLAHQIDYFRREERCAWWEYFRVHELDHDDLLDERKAVTGLEYVGVVGTTARSTIHRYRFPFQEMSLDEGDEVHAVKGEKFGTIHDVDPLHSTIDIKSTTIPAKHPAALHVNEVIRSGTLATSLIQFAQSIVQHGVDGGGPFRAARDLLLKKTPRMVSGLSGTLILSKEHVQNAAIRIAVDLDCSILSIQGPPGTGKTHTGARMIVHLAKLGKRIGVTAVGHKVIRTLLERSLEAAAEEKTTLSVAHKVNTKTEHVPSGYEEITDNGKAISALDQRKVLGGTAWLWSRDEAAEKLDYLFVDEAGQMSLAQVLAAARSAKNLILLGDPQQLEQPQQGAHPEGADVAALNHVLDGHKTIPQDRGLFLDVTWRLHPKICAFTSELYYENRLFSREGLEKRSIKGDSPFAGNGLFYVPVDHRGNQNKSTEEIAAVAQIVDMLAVSGTMYTDEEGKDRPFLVKKDILIVAPYNAQVTALQEKLPGLRIGTVDKFQGQEAPVVIYSMTSSSPEDAPRGMSFLYNPNRLNVATSRAQCVCIIVGAQKLFEPDCHTVDQMRWTNALCRFRELAAVVSLPS